MDHLPSRSFAINQAWLSVVMLAVDLIAWTQNLLLSGELAKAEPKTLRYRLLHVVARLTRGQRRLWLRIQRSWPWARDLAGCSGASRWKVETMLRDAAEDLLAFTSFPSAHWKKTWSTNPLERAQQRSDARHRGQLPDCLIRL
jgi:hypothetical protein